MIALSSPPAAVYWYYIWEDTNIFTLHSLGIQNPYLSHWSYYAATVVSLPCAVYYVPDL